MPNWAEQLTAIATAVSAIGLIGAVGAVVFAARQAREARIGRQAATAVGFFRRWNEDPLVETRRLVAQFETPEALRYALARFDCGELCKGLCPVPGARLFRAARRA